MKKYIICFVIALGLTLAKIITFKYVCETDENWPEFYGFPFVQSTNTSWVFSMSGELYFIGLIGNTLFWLLIILFINHFYSKIKLSWLIQIGKIFSGFIVLASLVIIISELFIFDWRLKFNHNDFKLNYYQKDLKCERTLQFFKI